MLQADYLILADAAEAVNGKLYILGAGWDQITAASFPLLHPVLAVAMRLRCSWNDTNQPYDFELDVLDEDGVSILPAPPGPIRGQIRMGRPPTMVPGDDQVLPLAMTVGNLQFQRPGAYIVVLRVQGLEMVRSPFRVVDVGAAGIVGQRRT